MEKPKPKIQKGSDSQGSQNKGGNFGNKRGGFNNRGPSNNARGNFKPRGGFNKR